MSTPNVRRASEADLPRIIELYQQLSLDHPREDLGPPLPSVYSDTFRRIDADPNQRLLVAETDGRIVGSVAVVVTPNLSYRGTPWAQVENMVVAEDARGQRIGEALIREAEHIARDAGCYKLTLTSNKRRTDAHRFYKRLGFANTHEGFRMDL